MKIRKMLLGIEIPICFLFVSCTDKANVIEATFPEGQAEVREVIMSIARDIESQNIEGLQAIHVESEKFTKFGPRKFERQDVASTNESEAAFFSSKEDFKYDIKDLKIDVVGEIAIATYYPHVSFVDNGEKKSGSGRQTFVFLKTEDQWKLIHEHGTSKPEDD